jgi:hypothetical protein
MTVWTEQEFLFKLDWNEEKRKELFKKWGSDDI